MMVFTEAMARMVADLAETGGEMEIELHDDHVRIGYSPRKGGGERRLRQQREALQGPQRGHRQGRMPYLERMVQDSR